MKIVMSYLFFTGCLIFLFVMIGQFILTGSLMSMAVAGLNLATAITNLLDIIKSNKL